MRELADGLWVAHVPLRFVVEMGRNMAVVRLGDGSLLVHSPAPLTDELRTALDALGRVRYVVPASALHGHLHMEDYVAAYSGVELFAAPGLAKRRPDLSFAGKLGDEPDPRWARELDQTLFRGHRLFEEVVFFHRPSRTLIAGDFAWHVTPGLGAGARLWAGWRTGIRPPPPYRLALRDKQAAGASIERVLSWDPERIIPGHGEVLEAGGRDALARGYSWLPAGR